MKLLKEDWLEEPQMAEATPDKLVWNVDTTDIIYDNIRGWSSNNSFESAVYEILRSRDYDEYDVDTGEVLDAIRDWDYYLPIFSPVLDGVLHFEDTFIHADTKKIFRWTDLPIDVEVGIPVHFYKDGEFVETDIVYFDVGSVDWQQEANADYMKHPDYFVPLEEFIHDY